MTCAPTSRLAAGDPSGLEGILHQIEQAIDAAAAPFASWIEPIVFFTLPLPGPLADLPFVVIWLVSWAAIITVYLGFIQVRGLKTSFDVVRGTYSHEDDPGEISHFQALSSAVSGTVGLGNIAGVAVAVTMGGPGATFWMILAGLLGMATKFAECTLGVKYRTIHEDGTVSGGAFQYLPVAFSRFGRIPARVLTWMFGLAIFFFGVAGGNMFQSNQTYTIVRDTLGGEEGPLGGPGAALIFGVLLATGIAIVIIGGVKSIGRVTGRLVPAMGIIYLLSCLVVIAVTSTTCRPPSARSSTARSAPTVSSAVSSARSSSVSSGRPSRTRPVSGPRPSRTPRSRPVAPSPRASSPCSSRSSTRSSSAR